MKARARFDHDQRVKALTASAMRNAPRWSSEVDAAVIRTEGRYREISALAARLGLASATVTARWHVVRAR